MKLGGRDRRRVDDERNDEGRDAVAGSFHSFLKRKRVKGEGKGLFSPVGISVKDGTCTLQPVALLVRALVTVDVVVAQFGQFEELQHFRRLVHLAPEVTVLQVQEEHLSS